MAEIGYKTVEWKWLRHAHLAKSPACLAYGRPAKDGARMNVASAPGSTQPNLQTLCNHGKGGSDKDWRGRV